MLLMTSMASPATKKPIPLVKYYTAIRENLVGTGYSIGIAAYLSSPLPYGRDSAGALELPVQNALTYIVGNLDIYGLV